MSSTRTGLKSAGLRKAASGNGVAALLGLLLMASLSGCAAAERVPLWKLAVAGDGPGNPALLQDYQVKVSNLPKSRSGNRPQYEVFGNSYAVLDSAEAFSEEGTASWYGAKFHGRPTASGEIYDMHKLTAAHKNLPLPTFVRVTRIDDGRSVVVKVNDRGPFVEDRIIDLSYAAAVKLGMLEEGKAQVRIEALSNHTGDDLEVQAAEVNPPVVSEAAAQQQPAVPVAPAAPVAMAEYIQAGAFSSGDNAQALALRLGQESDLPVKTEFQADRQLYRVRIGPLLNAEQIHQARQTLSNAGLSGYSVTLPQ